MDKKPKAGNQRLLQNPSRNRSARPQTLPIYQEPPVLGMGGTAASPSTGVLQEPHQSIISIISTVSVLSKQNLPFQRRRCRNGFTLVEMLVVVLIMALLVGLLVRTLGGAGTSSDKAVTQAKVEKVKAALEEFFAEYGQYPPVPFYTEKDMTYYDEKGNVQTHDKIQPMYMEFPVEWGGPMAEFSGTAKLSAWQGDASATPARRLFTFGVASFLVPRYQTVTNGSHYFKINKTALTTQDNKQWGTYTPAQIDQPRDLNACARWAPFLDGAISTNDFNRGTHINLCLNFRDAWNQDLRYESLPPHQSYKLWSRGPNKKDEEGRVDDIGVFMNQ